MKRLLGFSPEATDLKMPLVRGGDGRLIRVTINSPIRYRRAVYKIATFFKRELDYDFIQYGYNGHEDDENHVAFLWTHPNAFDYDDFLIPCIGATCFRWREYTDHSPLWVMQWVWFHPYFRNSHYMGEGLLKAAWGDFKKEFPDFIPEPPLSNAMVGFLKKMEVFHVRSESGR